MDGWWQTLRARGGDSSKPLFGQKIFFFFLHSGFSCAALPLGASEGRLGIIIQYSRGPARLTHIRQVQSAPIDTWTCDFSFSVLVENRWGAADTLARVQLWQEAFFSFFFFFFAYNPSTPQVINSSTDSGAVHYYADSWRYEFALSQLVPSEVCFRWFQHSRVQRFLLADLAPLLREQPSCSAGLKQCVLFLATSRGLFDVNDFTDSACDTPLTHWTLLTSVRAGETLAGVDIMMNCTPSLSGVWPWKNKIIQMLMSCGRFQGPLN